MVKGLKPTAVFVEAMKEVQKLWGLGVEWVELCWCWAHPGWREKLGRRAGWKVWRDTGMWCWYVVAGGLKVSCATFLYVLYDSTPGTTAYLPKRSSVLSYLFAVAQAFSVFETSLISVPSDEIPWFLQWSSSFMNLFSSPPPYLYPPIIFCKLFFVGGGFQ